MRSVILFLCLTSIACNPKALHGLYITAYSSQHAHFAGKSFNFMSDSTVFVSFWSDDLVGSKEAMGYFKVHKNDVTITFKHNPIVEKADVFTTVDERPIDHFSITSLGAPGDTLVFASVQFIVDGQPDHGFITDIDGFALQSHPIGQPTKLRLSYIGYAKKEISISRDSSYHVDVFLQKDKRMFFQSTDTLSYRFRHFNNTLILKGEKQRIMLKKPKM